MWQLSFDNEARHLIEKRWCSCKGLRMVQGATGHHKEKRKDGKVYFCHLTGLSLGGFHCQ